jgi:retinol-binding protein 3
LAEIKLGYPENNYGFQKIEILPGNIGYINLTTFNNPKTAGATAIAAMNFVANSDALIIDLRLNGGGDEAMARLISSYFFDKSTHLTDNFIRKDSITEQIWTQEWVTGPKITEAPIYILMSN